MIVKRAAKDLGREDVAEAKELHFKPRIGLGRMLIVIEDLFFN